MKRFLVMNISVIAATMLSGCGPTVPSDCPVCGKPLRPPKERMICYGLVCPNGHFWDSWSRKTR